MVRNTVNSFGAQVVALTIVIDFALVAVLYTLGPGTSMWWITIPVALVCAGAYMVIRGVQFLMLESDTMAVDDAPDADRATAEANPPARVAPERTPWEVGRRGADARPGGW